MSAFPSCLFCFFLLFRFSVAPAAVTAIHKKRVCFTNNFLCVCSSWGQTGGHGDGAEGHERSVAPLNIFTAFYEASLTVKNLKPAATKTQLGFQISTKTGCTMSRHSAPSWCLVLLTMVDKLPLLDVFSSYNNNTHTATLQPKPYFKKTINN